MVKLSKQIDHKMRHDRGAKEAFLPPAALATAKPTSKAKEDTIHFDRGEEGVSFRCNDANKTSEMALADIDRILVVQITPERGESGYSYLRLSMRDGTVMSLLESPFGFREYDELGAKLSRFYDLPLEITSRFD